MANEKAQSSRISDGPEGPQTLCALRKAEKQAPAEKHRAFLAVLEMDARHALTAMELVLSQPAISSQLIDNLNASIHLRSLLTDLFLVDEVAKVRQAAGA